MPTERTTTIRLTPQAYKQYTQLLEAHRQTLEPMGITTLSKLVNWAANEGIKIVEQKIKKIEG
jgi:2-C-methyl-D-erythritol 4-phosphate cytidylyltransferase